MKRLAVSTAILLGVLFTAGTTTAAPPQTATLGSTSGTPSQNICVDACTYVPFSNVSTPELVVPFDGIVTSFSINSGSTGNKVELRVLRPASGGEFTGAGTSSPQTLAGAVSTFTVSIPVKKGDVLGLDNDSSAIMFDSTSPTALTAYYEMPPLADGTTASPNHTRSGYRLLMSAVVQESATPPPPGSTPPRISAASLTHKRFRGAKSPTAVSAKAPRGSTFRFTLSTAARLKIVIARLLPGRRRGKSCVRPTPKLHGKRCLRPKVVGTLTRANEPQGHDAVPFTGRIGRRALKPGRYSATLTATNTAGTSKPVVLRFTIVR